MTRKSSHVPNALLHVRPDRAFNKAYGRAGQGSLVWGSFPKVQIPPGHEARLFEKPGPLPHPARQRGFGPNLGSHPGVG